MTEINQPLTMTETEVIAILRLADKAAKDLEREARKLPKPQVWNCSSIEQVKALKQHYERGLEDWRKRLPGSDAFSRQMFLSNIEAGQRELDEINMVLESLERFPYIIKNGGKANASRTREI